MKILYCTCSTCLFYGNTVRPVYWVRTNTIYPDTVWVNTSWYAKRGFINNEMKYMKYIWGTTYEKTTPSIFARPVSRSFMLFCKLLNKLNIFY